MIDAFRTTDCCGSFDAGSTQEKVIESYQYLTDDNILSLITQDIVRDELFGNIDRCRINLLMDIHLLIMYLSFIDKQRIVDRIISTTGEDKGNKYYVELYCIKCIRSKFYCRGINIDVLTKIFELFNLYLDTDLEDGIGYMQIEGDTPNINRIRS